MLQKAGGELAELKYNGKKVIDLITKGMDEFDEVVCISVFDSNHILDKDHLLVKNVQLEMEKTKKDMKTLLGEVEAMSEFKSSVAVFVVHEDEVGAFTFMKTKCTRQILITASFF